MVHHVNAAKSNDEASGDAFSFSAAGSDRLIVDAGAFLISRSSGVGANLDGSWTVTINGAVEGLGTDTYGLQVFGGIGSKSNITVGRGGDLFGTDSGIFTSQTITVVNLGTIGGGEDSIQSIGKTRVVNAGTLIGDVRCGAQSDTYIGFKKVGGVVKSGNVIGVIDLGDGDDRFTGGARAETVRDNPGGDTVKLGGGADTYLAVKVLVNPDDTDSINAGSGVDTYNAGGAGSSVSINLDKASHGFLLGARSALGGNVGGDRITGFENAIGGSAADTIFGSSAGNSLNGAAGDDHLYGLGGRDVLTGGANADTFHFLKLSDSGHKGSPRDLITDFNGLAGDKIDLGAITIGGDAAFNSFIGTAQFGGNAGEVRQFFSGGNTIVSGDPNGDGKADFNIALTGHIVLVEGNFEF